MKSLMLVSLLALMFGCKQFDGQLNVNSHLVYKKGNSSEVVLAGEYTASVKVKGSDKLVLKLQNDFEKKKMVLDLPKGTILPSGNGDLSFSAEDLNQPFAVNGSVNTAVTYSDVVETTERCALYGSSYCPYAVTSIANNVLYPNYAYHCGPSTRWGERAVKYRTVMTKKGLSLVLVQNEVAKAKFEGSEYSEKKEYLFYGSCR